MDFDFDTLMENSRRVKNNIPLDDVDDYIDDYYSDYSDQEEDDDNDEFFEEFRQVKANRALKFQYGIIKYKEEIERNKQVSEPVESGSSSTSDPEPTIEEYIQSGQQLLLDIYSKAFNYNQKYYQSANIKPIDDDFYPFENRENELEDFLENELYDIDQEEGLSSLDPKVFNFKKDEIVTATIKLLEQAYLNDPKNNNPSFSLHYQDFIRNFNGWKYKYNRLNIFHEIKQQKIHLNQEMLSILNYEEEPSGPINNIKIVYLTSGGGKSTFFKKYKNFIRMYEVDEFIKNHKDSFDSFYELSTKLSANAAGIMSLWFKYHLHQENKSGKLKNVILLFNHPNQIPTYFRRKFNELIIFPTKLNWDVRFFAENFFSLAHVSGKHMALLQYKDFCYYILTYFRRNFGINQVNKLVKKKIFMFRKSTAND